MRSALLPLVLAGCTAPLPMEADLAMPDLWLPEEDLAAPRDLAEHDPAWTRQKAGPAMDSYTGVWGTGADDVWLVGGGEAGGIVFHSVDGATWVQVPSGTSHALTDLIGMGRDVMYASGVMGTTLINTDGKKWVRLTTNTSARLSGVWGAFGGAVFTVGEGGLILRSNDTGLTWRSQDSMTKSDLSRAWGSGADDIYVVGAKGTLLHVKGGGAWEAQASGTTADLHAVWGASRSEVYVAGAEGTLLRSTDGGMTWKAVAGPWGKAALRGLWGVGADRYVVGDLGIARSTDGGTTWKVVHAAPEAQAIWGAGRYDIWVVGRGGLVLRGS
jgi:photosystem II stability/assembly factor-like uncharacterized protein